MHNPCKSVPVLVSQTWSFRETERIGSIYFRLAKKFIWVFSIRCYGQPYVYIYGGGERESKREGKIEGGIYFKELAHVIVGTGKFEACRAGQQAGNAGGISVIKS